MNNIELHFHEALVLAGLLLPTFIVLAAAVVSLAS